MPGHFTDFINLFHSTTILFKGKNFNRFSPPAGSNKQFHHSFFNCIGICIECKDTIGLFINHFIFFFKFCDTSACNIQHNHSIGFDSSGTNGLLQGSHCNSWRPVRYRSLQCVRTRTIPSIASSFDMANISPPVSVSSVEQSSFQRIRRFTVESTLAHYSSACLRATVTSTGKRARDPAFQASYIGVNGIFCDTINFIRLFP